jgi:uncharacterized protein YjbI with pentapeptide repeats
MWRQICCLCLLLFLMLLPAPVWAATTSPERTPLTWELLQERFESPIQSDGVLTLDLRQFVIDLTSENVEFRDRFYSQVQTQINRSKTPLGLDLSQSLIQGEFVASKLGLRSPLSAPTLPPLLTQPEREQLQRDQRFIFELSQQDTPVTIFRGPLKLVETRFGGAVNFANTFFLQRVEASDVTFVQEGDWSDTRFSRSAEFTGATFGRDVNFGSSTFFGKVGFKKAHFLGSANFSGSTFKSNSNFSGAEFDQLANLTRTKWLQKADFSQVIWHDRSLLSNNLFSQTLLLTDATFEKSTTFRESRFKQPVLLRDVSLLDQIDFSNARFTEAAFLNVAGMTFDSDQAKIFGNTGQIGRVLSVPVLQGNEDVLRNLVRNFREMEQIPDANQLEYTMERLRQEQLGQSLLVTRPREIPPLNWAKNAMHWLGLSLLLLLSAYGTSFELVFGVGCCAIALFGLLFWFIDRWRPQSPLVPPYLESVYMLSSYLAVTSVGITSILRNSQQPWFTLACLAVVLIPIPLMLTMRLYQLGGDRKAVEQSYFVEDGSLRQLRLLIGRLPIRPRFDLFRDRYMPILWERRWSWLNYYDFSLNNLLKFGFNDIRLRDEHLPGLITTLVWYQWSLGILYIALLLWTLSRTIPGLNLLIYLK